MSGGRDGEEAGAASSSQAVGFPLEAEIPAPRLRVYEQWSGNDVSLPFQLAP